MDTFVFIVHFLNENETLVMSFFGIIKIFKNAIVLQVNEVFAKHGFNA